MAAARAAAPGLPLVLMSADAAAIDAALAGGAAAEKPLIHAATAANWQAMAEVAKKHGCPLAIKTEDGDLNGLAELSEQVRGAGVEDLVLDAGTSSLAGDLAAWTQLRRLALKKRPRGVGYPSSPSGGADVADRAGARTPAVGKYAGVVVLDHRCACGGVFAAHAAAECLH